MLLIRSINPITMQLISYENSLFEVHFTKVVSPSNKFFVELRQGCAPVARFDMKQDAYERWKIVEPAPTWVRNVLPELSDAIRKYMAFPN